ncbi:M56 family metallopeptidase [Paludisphaera soli]|uniref:M56 family metallopeptidase n=1 Tax=Paludisphaera soli TaxID=2712865 RepID=UPI0013EB573A|nr:M56 family metallopeptidase [Paludisphaera soli]
MDWQILESPRPAEAALGALIVLAAGSLAVRLSRQPVRRARLAVLTLLGAAVLPGLAALPYVPRWSVGLWPASGAGSIARQGETPSASVRMGPTDGAYSRASPNIVERSEAYPPTAGPLAARPAPIPLPAIPFTAPSWRGIAIGAYAFAAAGWAAWWLIGQVALWRVARSARAVSPRVRDVFRELAGPDGEGVRLLESDRIALPFTYTWARPVILLPSAMADASEARALRYALAHEWSHVARRDAVAWNLAGLAGLVLLYQPLYWWLRRQLRISQDHLADARAAASGSAEDYAAFLVSLTRAHGGGPSWAALGIGDRRSNLYRRIVMLVQDREPLETRCRAAWTLAVALAAAVVLVAASGLRLDAAPAGEPLAKEALVQDEPKPAETPKPAGETLNYKGTVKDKDTGQPIAGAVVTVGRSILSGQGNRILEETRHTTAEDGTYAFTIPPEQTAERLLYIDLNVEHPDYATRAGVGYSLGMIRKNEGLGERPFFEMVELRPAKPITGKVETPEGGPAGGVEVLAYSRTVKVPPEQIQYAQQIGYGSFARTKTAADGSFRLPITTPGDGVFWILPESFAPEMHVLAGGRRGDLGAFRLKVGVKLSGRAVNTEGGPVAGLLLEARRGRGEVLGRLGVADAITRTTETDADGRFAFAPLPPGRYEIQATDYDARQPKSAGWSRREIPGVFPTMSARIPEGAPPLEIDLREVPHVVVEAGWVDSQGRPRSGWSSFFWGRLDETFWISQTHPDLQGRFTVKAPLGLKEAQFDFMTNEHASALYRMAPDAPLQEGRAVQLGTLERDVKGIEIVRYDSPVVVINAVDKDGRHVEGFRAVAEYVGDEVGEERHIYLSGGKRKTESIQDEQNDGRYRTTQMLPDREVKVTATAGGFQPASRTLKLAEGQVEEVTLVLEPQ